MSDVTKFSFLPFSSTTYTLNGKTRKSRCFSFFVSGTNRHFVLLRDKIHHNDAIRRTTTRRTLLDDGGNDRFVLFPLKYDAVWEMVRALVILLFLLFLCVRNLLKFLASYSRYHLLFRNQMQYKKAQASFWTAGTFCFFFTIGFFQNDALLLSSRYRVKISYGSLSLSLSLP